MSVVILLKRDASDPTIERKLETEEALEYLEKNDFCNPHQLIRDEESLSIRREFFRKYLSECSVFMVNTTCPAQETQERIRNLIRSVI